MVETYLIVFTICGVFCAWLIILESKYIPLPKSESKKVYESKTKNYKEYKGEEWKSISYRYRQSKNWRCEQCELNLDANRHLLHTHHIDRDTLNHSPTNLKALCIKCHHEQPYHDFSKSESFIEFHKKYKTNSFWNTIERKPAIYRDDIELSKPITTSKKRRAKDFSLTLEKRQAAREKLAALPRR